MSGPRLDINAWEIGGERPAGEIADVGRIEPFEEFIAGDWMVRRPEFVEWLEGPPNRDDHRGLRWPLNRGVLYDTDVAEVGGRPVPGDGTYYVPNDNPEMAILVSRFVRFNYLENRPPISGSPPTGLISVSGP